MQVEPLCRCHLVGLLLLPPTTLAISCCTLTRSKCKLFSYLCLVCACAGGTVVHMSSGWAALVAAVYLGKSLHFKEHELFHMEKEPANVPYVVLGTTFLWIGWFGVSSLFCF